MLIITILIQLEKYFGYLKGTSCTAEISFFDHN